MSISRYIALMRRVYRRPTPGTAGLRGQQPKSPLFAQKRLESQSTTMHYPSRWQDFSLRSGTNALSVAKISYRQHEHHERLLQERHLTGTHNGCAAATPPTQFGSEKVRGKVLNLLPG